MEDLESESEAVHVCDLLEKDEVIMVDALGLLPLFCKVQGFWLREVFFFDDVLAD